MNENMQQPGEPNSRWIHRDLYESHSRDRKQHEPKDFTTFDRSHIAGHVSLVFGETAIASSLGAMKRLPSSKHLEVWRGIRPEHSYERLPGRGSGLHGVKLEKTQAAHRTQTLFVTLVRGINIDSAAYVVAAKNFPQFEERSGIIRAPLYAFAKSLIGQNMVWSIETTKTLLPTAANVLDSYIEGHGGKDAHTMLIVSQQQAKFLSPEIIAASTLESGYRLYLPKMITIYEKAISHYKLQSKTNMTEFAEEARDFLVRISQNRSVPTAPHQAQIPAASFIALNSSLKTFLNAEATDDPKKLSSSHISIEPINGAPS